MEWLLYKESITIDPAKVQLRQLEATQEMHLRKIRMYEENIREVRGKIPPLEEDIIMLREQLVTMQPKAIAPPHRNATTSDIVHLIWADVSWNVLKR